MINLDTNTAIAFVAEGSPIRHQLKAFAGNQQLVMVKTAYDEFLRIIRASGGGAEQKRSERFLLKVTVVSDNPSRAAKMLKPTRRIGSSDIIILGTGDHMGIVTMTADAKAVQAASAQGVGFNVYLHPSYSLTGS